MKSSRSGNGNLREVYDLLDKLCKNLVGPSKHKETLRHVSQYMSNWPSALCSSLPYDEAALVSKISDHLLLNRTQNDVTLFLNLHQNLKASKIDQHQRSALLTFLYFMADTNTSTYNGFVESSSFKTSASSTRNNILSSIKEEFLQKCDNTTVPNMTAEKLSLYSRITPSPKSSSENLRIAPMRTILSISDSCSESGSKSTMASNSTSDSNDINDDIVQNVIYSFMGIQGKYLKKDIISGGFKLDTKAKNLNVVQAGMLLRLSELGFYREKVQSFTDTNSGKCALGLMGQGLISALRNELTKYYGMVAMLQEQWNKQRKIDCNDWQGSSTDRVTLMKLLVWSVDPLQRLQWLATIAEACQEKKGGDLASTVYQFFSNGDPMVKALVKDLLMAICGPLQQMLSRWLLEGEVGDPHSEFFIECLSEISQDRLWHDKYRVRIAMLPSFISTDMANKILVTGKSINFLREVCEDKTPIKGREDLKHCFETNGENIFAPVADTKLHLAIDSSYLFTSKKVLDIVMGPHKLLDHLQAMRRYLLLGQGDFIGILMENLKSELDKSAKELYCYDLSSIMDAAIRSTNAQYDDPEILNHLDVRLLNAYDGDTGWDIFSLQYTVRGPLATILETSMHNYQALFGPLWKMKHMEFLLSFKIWKEQIGNAKLLRRMSSQLNPLMYRLHLLTSEMIHFINQMQYYILFEVIECAWAEFQNKIQQAKALDDILNAHDDFLESIKSGAFLDVKSQKICVHMGEVYRPITCLELWQDKFFEICFNELESRKKMQEEIKQSEVQGVYGVSTEKRLQRDEEEKIFEQYLITYQTNLDKIGSEYESGVRQFLLSLNSNNDHNLQLFGIRLDFNEHYKKRDQRLAVPLTFEHMRMSNIFFKKSMSNSRFSVN